MNFTDKRILQRIRVPLGFLFAAIFLFFARPVPVSLAIGGSFAVLGLLIRGWSSGHIRKNQELAVSGPYAFTRNPLYLGSFILGLGFTIASGVWWLGLLFIALFLGIYLPVMRVEASTLAELFGEDYQRYAAAVPLLFPRLTPYGGERNLKFDPGLYLRYREYRAALGLLVGWCVLALKAFLVK